MKNANVSMASTEYGTIVLNEKTGQYWHLNPTAEFILETLGSGTTNTETAIEMTKVFQVPLETAQKDVDSTQHYLEEIGAL